MNRDMNFTEEEIHAIRKDYLTKHGIFTGVSTRTHRNVSTRVLSTYWTKCPFLTDDRTKHEKFTVESETPTFIKFHQKPYRFRKEVIRKGDAYTQLSIAYRDTALNKERFNFGGDTRVEALPNWEVVKHYTDVLVRWDDADHSIDERFKELWFLSSKVMYMGVSASLREGDGYSGRTSVVVNTYCSPVKTERTPTPVPVRSRGTFRHYSSNGFRRNDYDGNPFEKSWSTNLEEEGHSGHNKFILLDGEEIKVSRHDNYDRRMAMEERFSAQCETAYLPYEMIKEVSYQPTRKTMKEKYNDDFITAGMMPLTEMKHSASAVPFTDAKMEAMRKHKEAFADELVRTCLHPKRLERLYGEGFVDIIADQ
jgi:hypothetical protein